MTRTLQPLSIKGLRSKFAAALGIKESKVGIELAADDPVLLTASTWYPAPLMGNPIRELQLLADTLGFRLSIVPNEQNPGALLISLLGEVTVSFYFDAEGK